MIETIALGFLISFSLGGLVLALLLMSTTVHDIWTDFQSWRWERKMERESAKLPMGVLEALIKDRQDALRKAGKATQ
jgi:hypothetical protein